MAEQAAQDGLTLVHAQLEQCKSPQSFLFFALAKLRQAATDIIRARRRERKQTSIDDLGEASAKPGEAREQRNELEEQTQTQEQLQALLEALARLPDNRKRLVIWWKFVAECSDSEIAGRLGETVENVRVLRNRGLKELQQDPRLGAYFPTKHTDV